LTHVLLADAELFRNDPAGLGHGDGSILEFYQGKKYFFAFGLGERTLWHMLGHDSAYFLVE
jgi:hypothetical protein